MFEQFLIKPIFNILVTIYGLVPGHNFGVAIIIFTFVARAVMWPMVKKQLHHAAAMRKLQPELKKIKKESGGDKQKESLATMALYKEREINPFASIGYLVIQLPVFIALYQVVRRIADNPQAIIDNSYGFVADLPWIKTLATDPSQFDRTILGFGDLTQKAWENGVIFWPAMIIVAASALVQFYSSKQLLATQGEKESLRKLLKDQSEGKDVDQSEVMAASSKAIIYVIPVFIFFISSTLASALPLYWLVNGAIAFWQQRKILAQDVTEMAAVVDDKEVIAEVLAPKEKPKLNAKQKREAQKSGKSTSSKNSNKRKKRR